MRAIIRPKIAAACFVAALAACQPAPAVISDISESSLRIQTGAGTTSADVYDQALQGCQLYDRRPTLISERCLDQYCISKEVLFACR